MNILHVSENKVWGGNEQQLFTLITGLESFGVNQSLFCFDNSPLIEKLEQIQIEIFAIEKCSPFSKKQIQTFKKIVLEKKIDLIHLHTSASLTGFMVADLFENLKVKAVFSKKAVSSKSSFLSKFKYNYKGVNSVVCVSEYVKNHFKAVLKVKNRFKLTVIPDGVKEKEDNLNEILNIKEELNLKPDTFVIGNIANHTGAKNLTLLVEILNYLVNDLNHKDIHVIQIGNFTKITETLKRKIKIYNLEPYISFLGFYKKAYLFQPQFNAFLMTSEREGGPTVIIEAFKYKTPVVTTNVGLAANEIVNGQHAFVAKVNDFKGLAQGIIKLKTDRDIQKNIVENANELFLKNFTAKRYVERTFQHYEKIMKE